VAWLPSHRKDPHLAAGPASDAAPPEFASWAPEAAANLTLCAQCHTVVQLTNEQAVIAEDELIALDMVPLAFCPRCR
jgi:cytochrome c553